MGQMTQGKSFSDCPCHPSTTGTNKALAPPGKHPTAATSQHSTGKARPQDLQGWAERSSGAPPGSLEDL